MKTTTSRPTSPGAEELLDLYFPVLDQGFVALVDYMGTDECIERAARTSYGGGGARRDSGATRQLIRYLRRHGHTTPSEMCLSGDTRIPTYPGGPKVPVKFYAMRELAKAFDGGRDGSWAKLTYIRTLRPDGAMGRTKIKRVWSNGVKPVFRVRTKLLGREIVATDTHPFLCEDGVFRKLSELTPGSRVKMNGAPALTSDMIRAIQARRAKGMPITEVAAELGISTGAVYNHSKFRVKRTKTRKRKPDCARKDPRAIARKMMPHCACALCDNPGSDVHHIDKNPHNNAPENLVRLCAKHHRHIHTGSKLLVPVIDEIESIEPAGEEEVFDLETVEDTHNFVAEGFIVHNCELKLHCCMPIFVARQWIRHRTASTSEQSGRYAIVPTVFYTPERAQLQPQSTSNNQGREGEGAPAQLYDEATRRWDCGRLAASDTYEWMTDQGFARELARIDLPLSTYTEWYWKIDLHNLLHFLKLRVDSHAQWEIQQYGRVMAGMLKRVAPLSFEAWIDYDVCGARFSRMEMDVLRYFVRTPMFRGKPVVCPHGDADHLHGTELLELGLSPREVDELIAKLEPSDVPEFPLDLSLALTPEQAAERRHGKHVVSR